MRGAPLSTKFFQIFVLTILFPKFVDRFHEGLLAKVEGLTSERSSKEFNRGENGLHDDFAICHTIGGKDDAESEQRFAKANAIFK